MPVAVHFLFFFFVFFILTTVLLYICVISYIIHHGVGVGRRRRRERAQTTPDVRRLGHRCVFFPLFLRFYILTTVLLFPVPSVRYLFLFC